MKNRSKSSCLIISRDGGRSYAKALRKSAKHWISLWELTWHTREQKECEE